MGDASLARVIGPVALTAEFYACLGDMCCVDQNNLTICLKTGCNTPNPGCTPSVAGSSASYFLEFALLVGIGFNVAAQDMIISEQLQIMFGRLTYSKPAVSDPCDTVVECG
jgi:hypothetical protein